MKASIPFLLLLFVVKFGYSQHQEPKCNVTVPASYSLDDENELEVEIEEIREFKFQVFNRQGDKLFDLEMTPTYLPQHIDENNYHQRKVFTGWRGLTGVKEKKPLEPNAYMYVINAVCLDGSKERFRQVIMIQETAPEEQNSSTAPSIKAEQKE